MKILPHMLRLVVVALVAGASPAMAQFDDGLGAMRADDYAKAEQSWRSCAGSDPRCQYALGYLYQFGLSVAPDPAAAKDWYEKAAAQNNPDALYALGLLYETGDAGRKDLAQALSYYHKATEAGLQPDAEYAIGRMVLRGRGVPRDPVEGIKWLRKAADHNQTAAQYMLGAAYEAGWGVAPDDVEAYYWYSRSLQGDAVELQEQDMAFQPKIAIDALKHRMPASAIRRAEARLKKTTEAAAEAPRGKILKNGEKDGGHRPQ